MVQVSDSQCFNIFILIFVFLFNSVYCQQKIGNFCTQDNGGFGICRVISNCPSALSALKNTGLLKNRCGFENRRPLVCCGDENVNSLPIPVTSATTQKTSLRVGDKARAKCKEYQQYVYTRPTIHAAPQADCVVKRVTNIIGGELAEVKEFPHMAAIGYAEKNDEIQWLCGGSLISELFVLTAAHCLNRKDFGVAKYIRVGDINLINNAGEAEPQDFTISQEFRHHNYRRQSKYNDIALLKLNRPATLNNYVRPACLETNSTIDRNIKPLATGWGRVESSSRHGSDVLMKVALEYFTEDECNQKYSRYSDIRLKNGIDDTQACAGSHTERKDTCLGDSGGPLQVANDEPYCTYNVVGVTSFGIECGKVNTPGVYTKVARYIEWIESIVWS